MYTTRHRSLAASLFVVLVALTCAASCLAGCGAAGGAPSASASAGVGAGADAAPACALGEGRSEPFVVDWAADQRADLETALDNRIVVVAYSCEALRVLPECQVEGAYHYSSVTEKEQQLELEGADELRANLPLSGAKLSDRAAAAEHDRGAKMDIALSIVGKKTASRGLVLTSDLRGECAGATHYVRSATLGAFRLSSGQDHRQEGQPDACRAASSTGDAPVSQCSAPLRLELRPVRAGAPASRPEGQAPDESETVTCGPGFVATDVGTCISAASGRPHICAVDDAAGCTRECDRGSMASCAYLGRMYETGRGVARDLDKAIPLLDRACKGGATPACGRLGEILVRAGKRDQGVALLRRSCEQGFAVACTTLAQVVLRQPGGGSVDAVGLLRRDCLGGHGSSCASLATVFHDGIGVHVDDTEAHRYAEMACQADAPQGCVVLAANYQEGRGAPLDLPKAASIVGRSCERGASESCTAASLMAFTGQGVPRDNARGVALLTRACEGDDRASCLALGMRYLSGVDVPKDPARAERYLTRACESGIDMACKAARRAVP